MRHSSQPLTTAQRTDLERPLYRQPRPPVRQLVADLLLTLPGALIGWVGIGCLSSLQYFGLGPKILLIVLSAIALLIALPLVLAGLWQWRRIMPRTPVLVRAPRDLSMAAAEVTEIDVSQAWNLENSDEDNPDPLLVLEPDGKLILLYFPMLDDLWGDFRRVIRRRITLTRFDGDVIAIESQGEEVPCTDIDDPDTVVAILDLNTEAGLHVDSLPKGLCDKLWPPTATN